MQAILDFKGLGSANEFIRQANNQWTGTLENLAHSIMLQ
ncbi:uncharacterized protein METZ01_LOCUS366161 [marine metagenome]|uniref:Uncharacterized protein n=1 Tax=marine metagenome TaxID=408172 RepID=A0A382SVR6_9ZZZZ